MRRTSRTSSSKGSPLLNILTLFFLAATVLVCCVVAFIFSNPNVLPEALRPLPPIPEFPTLTPFPTNTATRAPILPDTWTPEPSKTPLPSATIAPTATPEPTSTSFFVFTATPTRDPRTPAPTSTRTPVSQYAYVLQSSPLALQNFTRQELGCNWMGVGGQVFDLTGAPITSLEVHLGGSLAGKPMELITLTGLATLYGPGGYEFTLAEQPTASRGTLYLQLIGQGGLPLSDKIYFDTFANCNQALLLINFKQIK